jgi:hypothetical protein
MKSKGSKDYLNVHWRGVKNSNTLRDLKRLPRQPADMRCCHVVGDTPSDQSMAGRQQEREGGTRGEIESDCFVHRLQSAGSLGPQMK